MDRRLGTVLHWAPRVLAIAFAVFTALFALDVFQEGYRGTRLLAALMMHLLPTTGVVVGALLLAWQWPWVGAALFAAVGTLYAINTSQHPSWIVAIAGPMFVTAALFLADALVHRRRHA